MLGMVLPTVGWALLHQLATKKMSPQTRPQASLLPSPQKTPDLCQVDSGSDWQIESGFGFCWGFKVYFMCMCVLPSWLYVYHMRTWCLQRSEEQKRMLNPWNWTSGGYEPPCRCWHWACSSARAASAAKPSLQPPYFYCLFFFFLVLLPFHWASFFFFFFLFFLFLRQGLTV